MSEFKQKLLAKLKDEIPLLAVDQLPQREHVTLLDVREKHEFEAGHLPNAVHCPRGKLELIIEELVPDKSTNIVFYCGGGTRARLAANTALQFGFTRVQCLEGGFRAWKELGRPIVIPESLSEHEAKRYARHLSVPEIGTSGQLKLINARVLIVGAGGLGSPCALYLAAAGVGTLGLADGDKVDLSNLQRQILHGESTLGLPKVESAEKTLKNLNHLVNVQSHPCNIKENNADDICSAYDLVIDGTDNFETKYLLNKTCQKLAKPFIHGSVHHFFGQVALFEPGGPCYRCLYPEPPSNEEAPNCSEVGVMGAVPGFIGTLQAIEAIKWIAAPEFAALGTLFAIDTLNGTFNKLKLNRKNRCPDCASA